MTQLTKFASSFAASFGLLFAAVTFLLSHAIGGFSWHAVSIASAIGLAVGSSLLASRLPAIMRAEIERVYATFQHEFIVAVMKQCDEQGIELDDGRLYCDVAAAARSKLRGITFQTLDIEQELSPHA